MHCLEDTFPICVCGDYTESLISLISNCDSPPFRIMGRIISYPIFDLLGLLFVLLLFQTGFGFCQSPDQAFPSSHPFHIRTDSSGVLQYPKPPYWSVYQDFESVIHPTTHQTGSRLLYESYPYYASDSVRSSDANCV